MMVVKVPDYRLSKYNYAVRFSAYTEIEMWEWSQYYFSADYNRVTAELEMGKRRPLDEYLILFRDEPDYILFLLRWS